MDCQAGAVAGRPIISTVNTRAINAAAIVTNPVQRSPSAGNIVLQPAQKPIVVGPTVANDVQQHSMPVVGGRIIAASTTGGNMPPRPVVQPTNPPVATGTILLIRTSVFPLVLKSLEKVLKFDFSVFTT